MEVFRMMSVRNYGWLLIVVLSAVVATGQQPANAPTPTPAQPTAQPAAQPSAPEPERPYIAEIVDPHGTPEAGCRTVDGRVVCQRDHRPLVTPYDAGVWQGGVTLSADRRALGVGHRIETGANFDRASLKRSNDAIDGVNLLFLYQAPYSVRLLNTPVKTHDRIHQLELYASDKFSFSRLSVMAGVSAHCPDNIVRIADASQARDAAFKQRGAFVIDPDGQIKLRYARGVCAAHPG